MPSVEKIIQKMKSQPNGIRREEAEKVLAAYGFNHLRQRGSHRSYRNASGEMLVLVDESPLKAVYVKDVLKRIGSKELL
ncbi:MAG: type II toxin-antitoxin system HicA family toxin [Spirochaetaceae bacterium]|jgi:predicted RNA binding protein YcfA (HicA-like mRNA interferase family)|nr:type II toxin-antitoxin system HicA family toxin [Spirochaetaceae bacterium]